jgi:signal transduction histidine kinase
MFEVQKPPELERAESLSARQTLSVPLALLTTVAQFIAHDVRHHLSTVYANTEFLGNRCKDPVDEGELLAEIRFAIDCMTDQCDALLLFTRTGHTMAPRLQPLRRIIEQAVQMARSHPETRRVTISEHDMPVLEGCIDGMKLRSAVFNLLLNACQAANVAPDVRAVDIDIREDLSSVLIRVSDTGPGVSHAIRETLFQPFVKTEGSRGMGLGLTIAHHIAQAHGGSVYLDASKPGRTVFVLTLPKTLFGCS